MGSLLPSAARNTWFTLEGQSLGLSRASVNYLCGYRKKKKAKHKKQPKKHVQIIFICSITTIMRTALSVLLSAFKYYEKFWFRTKWEERSFGSPCLHLNIVQPASFEEVSVTEETAFVCRELIVKGYQWIHWHRCILWEIQMKYLHPRRCKYKLNQMNKGESKTKHCFLSKYVPARDKSEMDSSKHLTGQQHDAKSVRWVKWITSWFWEHNGNEEELFITDVEKFYQTQDGAMSPQVGNRKVSPPYPQINS